MIEYHTLGKTIHSILKNGFNDDEHVIYYTYLKPNLNINSNSRFGIHTTISRTYSGICDESLFEEELNKIALNQKPFNAKIDGLDYFGDKNNIPVLKFKSKELNDFHKKIISRLLFCGSPSLSPYLYRGYGKRLGEKSYLTKNPDYKPHISLQEGFSLDFVSSLIGKEILFDTIYFAINSYGTWNEPKKIKFKK